MTTEKMTVHKALCELKTLDARIQKSIRWRCVPMSMSSPFTAMSI